MRPSRHICPVCGRIAAPRLRFREFTIAACPGCRHEFTTDMAPDLGEAYDPQYFRTAHANWFANPDIELFDELAGVIARHAGKEASIIDVGCGNGAFLDHLRQKDFSSLTGLDIIPQTLPAPIRYLETPIEDYAGEETFDVVVSLANIEHLADPRDAMIRLARLLAPKGLLAVYTVANESLLYRTAKLLAAADISFAARRLYDPHHLNHFSVPSLARTAAAAGLLPVRTTRRDIPQNAVDLPQGALRPLVGLAVSTIAAASKAVGGQMLQLALFTNAVGSGI